YVTNRAGRILAMNTLTEEVVWSVEKDSPINASPAILDGVLYVGAGNGVFYALDTLDGHVLWLKRLTDSAIYASAAVDDGRAYVFGLDGHLVALDIDNNGEILWEFEMGSPAYSSPVLLEDVLYVVGEKDGLMYAL